MGGWHSAGYGRLREGKVKTQLVRAESPKAHSPGQRPGLKDEHEPYALQGQKPNYYGVALTGRIVNYIFTIIPRALPRAMGFWAFSPH